MTVGCVTLGVPEPRAVSADAATYVVVAHDTLYSIAWRHDLDYRDLARWNGIGPDYTLSIGQTLRLAPPADRVAAPAPRVGPTHDVPPVAVPAPPSTAPSAPLSAGPPVSTVGGVKWVWPTERVSAPRPVPGGGILLLGRLGQDVRAAGAGRVVYTGSGIRGYGNLVIIKHGETLLSSYAHNRELLVHEGQNVEMGQLIARMGTGPHQVVALYFEIRLNGKPTDPLRYLTP